MEKLSQELLVHIEIGEVNRMFVEGQEVIYKKTNEIAIVEDANNDSTGEWYYISINNGDCITADVDELQSI